MLLFKGNSLKIYVISQTIILSLQQKSTTKKKKGQIRLFPSQMEQTTECDSFVTVVLTLLLVRKGAKTPNIISQRARRPEICEELVVEFSKDHMGLEQLTATLGRKSERNVSEAYSRLIICLI